jgi:hypothetical protein
VTLVLLIGGGLLFWNIQDSYETPK